MESKEQRPEDRQHLMDEFVEACIDAILIGREDEVVEALSRVYPVAEAIAIVQSFPAYNTQAARDSRQRRAEDSEQRRKP